MESKVFGYARVSTADQNEQRQIDALKAYISEERDIFVDKQSGKDFNRKEYQRMRAGLRSGDTVIIKSIDRLGRNYSEIVREWRELTQDMQCHIAVIDMPLLDTRGSTCVDGITGKFIADLVLQILAYVADAERSNIRQRQAEGIASAKMRGKRFGRPRIDFPEEFPYVYERWVSGVITGVQAMKELSLKPNTFYRLTKAYKDNLAGSKKMRKEKLP